MANRLKSAGIDLDSIFQSYISGDIVQSTTTNIQNGGTDVKSRYAGRDNKAGNASTAVNFTFVGANINNLFNKIGATYDVTISGTVTFNGAGQAPTITHSPSNTPTQATLNPTTKTNVGSYTITGSAVTGFAVTLPGNYSAGTYSGTFTINQATISGTATDASATYNGISQSGTVITNVLPIGATYSGSVTASGTNAGSYTSSITGSGNYTGTVNSGTFTINKKALTSFTAPSYYFDPYASFWVVQVITISGGIANSPFDGMTISAFTNTSSPDLPVTLSGVFDGAGNFTYTFPNGGAVLFQNIGGQDGFIRLTTALSLNYTGTFTARLRPLG